MADIDYTHIVLVVDRSGSMSARAQQTIDGVNEYLDNQREVHGNTTVSAVLFDSRITEPWHFKPLEESTNFSKIYHLGGSTALLDALGHAITSTANRVSQMNTWEQPGKVVMLVVTDGYENASTVWAGRKDELKGMIEYHEQNENWDIIFMGAGIDAFGISETLGVKSGKTVAFSGSPEKQREAWLAASAATTNARSGEMEEDADFFGEQWRSRIR